MGDAEMPSVFFNMIRKARQEHKCCECQRVINVGEKYHLFKGCWEGKWSNFKTCMDCQDLREEIAGLYRGDEWPPFGNLAEWVHEAGMEFSIQR